MYVLYVFSTYVEVIPVTPKDGYQINSILHVCGGDPKYDAMYYNDLKYSPRMWRWSRFEFSFIYTARVFSTYVEVILYPVPSESLTKGILHVCGGDP